MRMLSKSILALFVLAAWSAPVQSQQNDAMVPEEGAVQVMLLRQKSVRNELKLTEDQAKRINDFSSQQWKKAQELKNVPAADRDRRFDAMIIENEQFLAQTLRPDQRKRLNEVTLQVAGLLWINRPDIAAQLALSPEQRTRARTLQQEARREAVQALGSTSSEGRREKLREIRKTSHDRLFELLSDEQEVRWKQMIGAPFDGELIWEAEQKTSR